MGITTTKRASFSSTATTFLCSTRVALWTNHSLLMMIRIQHQLPLRLLLLLQFTITTKAFLVSPQRYHATTTNIPRNNSPIRVTPHQRPMIPRSLAMKQQGIDDIVLGPNSSPTEIIQAALRKVASLDDDSDDSSLSSPSSSPLLLKADIYEYFQELDQLTFVDQSTLTGAGRGLFAKQDCPAGTIVTMYPVHGLGVDNDDGITNSIQSMCLAMDPVNQAYFDRQSDKSINNNAGDDSSYRMYLIGSRPLQGYNVKEAFDGCPLFVDVNPNTYHIEQSIGRRGHFANDGACIIITETNQSTLAAAAAKSKGFSNAKSKGFPKTTTSGSKASNNRNRTIMMESNSDKVLSYYHESRAKRNCVHVPFGPAPMLALVTTSNVRKGEELFTTYGGSYWMMNDSSSSSRSSRHDNDNGNDDSNSENSNNNRSIDFEVTPEIQNEAMLVAKDLMANVKSIQQSYSKQASMFQRYFDS